MEERHRRVLLRQNPQWRDESLDTYEFRRDAYDTIARDLKHRQILAVVGLRRVGKTVLLKQIMGELDGTVPKLNLGYISFDDRDFQRYETADELVNYFLTFSDREKMRYLFLDEIQKIPNWPDLLKTLYDTEKNLKMVISGSSSLEMKGYRETLAGRIMTHYLPVLTFREFVRYFGLESFADAKNLAREYDMKFLMNKEKYSSLFESYLAKGAFPELLDQEDETYITRYIKESIVEKVISDISRHVRPRREDIVSDLLLIFSRNTARLYDITNIANTLSIDRNSAAEYINALKNAFLIKVDYNYTKSALKQARTSKKAYIAHSCIPLAIMGYSLKITGMDGSDVGYLVETTIANSLEGTNFWRTPQKYEVDIVIPGAVPLPIEVKYRGLLGTTDLRGINKFMDKFGVKKGVLVTKDVFAEENIGDKKIIRIPAWLFLLLEQDDLSKL
ncbi:MAG: ATP-binding protein [Candidatus Thermoplasmatota archaeon]|nr:ATP-binding protein [Candidatus Thermoplasmatota archaeon]MBU4070815.1 ATP-binding protein [Candidatus Thermoplasmatota archaeon]MBU4144687.1 ATP-binding protein [Candidatus Thermoplasmatota archaeon]MBU4592651.1 ATP-binding protein [Candidatus Thermoplasmatota archaeon]